ncbi:MAG: hypothetical protein CBARDMAM_6254 [uncultured Caballeronia sp.]|nr:MAG: hypothetical protein CBARDMAM_6254 [uncultured Caballeronia sp.]
MMPSVRPKPGSAPGLRKVKVVMRESSSSAAPQRRRFGVELRVGFLAVYAAVRSVISSFFYDYSTASTQASAMLPFKPPCLVRLIDRIEHPAISEMRLLCVGPATERVVDGIEA